MELQMNHPTMFERRPLFKRSAPAVRWFKEWVPQELVSTGGKCMVLKWVTEDILKALREKCNEAEQTQPEPEPSTEVLFLCNYEGCGKTFTDATLLRKHAHIHGVRQYACHYEGCTKKFVDSSKLKRHFLSHTGQRDYICPHEGCGKAFSLDFNLRSHMRTHSHENYHICPYEDCGKRYQYDYKLQAHIKAHHEKNTPRKIVKQTPPAEKVHNAVPKASPAAVYGSAAPDRPYACPYEGCSKAYIHEYKLNLHLRREHPGHTSDENGKRTAVDPDVDATTVEYTRKSKGLKRSKADLVSKMPPSKIARKSTSLTPTDLNVVKKQWPRKQLYDEDSEETEEDRDVEEDGWRYQEMDGDEEETEDED